MGLQVNRVYTKIGVNPFDQFEWEIRDSVITNPDGSIVFEMKGVEVPAQWSQRATDIVASKYFRKAGVNGGGETSVKQVVARIVATIQGAGADYFATPNDAGIFVDELAYMLCAQIGAFNSPVWFNVGLWHEYGITGEGQAYRHDGELWNGDKKGFTVRVDNVYEHPQASACFIQSVDDSLSGICDLLKNETMLFKYGSGTGTNFSSIRGKGEKLAGGGESSGLMSFLEVFDRAAGAIKSGGTVRRAAKMVCLDVNHPEIESFITWKMCEEKKAHALIAAGYSSDFNGEAYATIGGQNANNSVRVSDEFMTAAKDSVEPNWYLKNRTDGKIAKIVKATELWRLIAEAAHACADPGVQYDDTINTWHTCPNSGRINASNPCCFTGQTLVTTSIGAIPFTKLVEMFDKGESLPFAYSFCFKKQWPVKKQILRAWVSGQTKKLVEVRTRNGLRLQCTPEHRFLLSNGSYVEAQALFDGMELQSLKHDADGSNDIVAEVVPIDLDKPIDVYDIEVEDTHNFGVLDSTGMSTQAVIVHNSEFMFLDDTACNLASLNLTKFLRDDNTFDIPAFRHAVRAFFIAQEILVGLSSYPTSEIAKNSHDFRPLGLGYANLGTLLMLLGKPYDSDEGRSIAASITSLMTAHAYLTSAEMAKVKGPFAGFAVNRDNMLDVMQRHHDCAFDVYRSANSWAVKIADASIEDWKNAIAYGQTHGYRNAQATVLAPTGCLVAGLLVATDQGLTRIEDLGDVNGEQWQDINIRVQTDDGPKKATKFYVNGIADVIEAETLRGFTLRGTVKHQIKIVNDKGVWEWRRLDGLRENDTVPLAMNQIIGKPITVHLPACPPAYRTNHMRGVCAPPTMTAKLAELVGAFMANGSFHTKGLRFSMFAEDTDAIDRYAAISRELFNVDPTIERHDKYTAVCVNSTQIRDWWAASGFSKLPGKKKGKGYITCNPDAILATNDPEIYGAYLRGLFTSDGTVHSGMPSLSNKDKRFTREVQTIMMALGVPTKLDQQIGGKSQKPVYRLRVASMIFCQKFVEKIGFSAKRKADLVQSDVGDWSRADFVPVTKDLLDEVCPIGHDRRSRATQHIYDHNGVPRHLCLLFLAETGSEKLKHLLSFFYDKIESTELCGQEPTYDLSVPENVTYVANSFVSHNTIGLLMDCDTTGIEPDFALVKTKKLAGGGTMKIVNQAVTAVMLNLGYSLDDAEHFNKEISDGISLEQTRWLLPEHRGVFACANEIDPMGHVKMMASVQPFLSGAISKTVNLPNSATVDDVQKIYEAGHALGLKSIALYRDGCKASQPLNASKKTPEASTNDDVQAGGRGIPLAEVIKKYGHRKLPKRRTGFTQEARVGGHKLFVRTGEYPDGKLGEIFVDMHKEGATLRSLVNCLAIAVSTGLQYGVPLDAFVDKFTFTRFEPQGVVEGDENVKFSTSIVDYIFRMLGVHYLGRDDLAHVKPVEVVETLGQTMGIDAPPCNVCGTITVRNAACYRCLNCGNSMGCS